MGLANMPLTKNGSQKKKLRNGKKMKTRTTKNQGDWKQKTDTIAKPKHSILGKKKKWKIQHPAALAETR